MNVYGESSAILAWLLDEDSAAEVRRFLTGADIIVAAAEVVDRARQSFPGEPIRTLDAIHLASALVARGAVAELRLLSLDDRVRRAAARLGLEVLPP